jgi:hypothetical protein
VQLRALKNQIAQLGADQMTMASADRLLGGRPLPKVSSAISLRRAQTLTQNFMRFYHYALPLRTAIRSAGFTGGLEQLHRKELRRSEATGRGNGRAAGEG